jgi:hypothetical protein
MAKRSRRKIAKGCVFRFVKQRFLQLTGFHLYKQGGLTIDLGGKGGGT